MKISNGIAVLIPFLVLVFVAFGVQLDPGPLQSISYKSFMAVFACLCLWSVLRLADRVGNIDFSLWWGKTSDDNKANYLRVRFASYAFLFSFIFAFA